MTGQDQENLSYESMEKRAPEQQRSLYVDAYESFGWTYLEKGQVNDRIESARKKNDHAAVLLTFRRERKILNKMELTRLQRNFEACMDEIEALERSATGTATMMALAAGLIGTAFMAGCVFAVLAAPPIIWLAIVLAIPGFLGWMIAVPIYQWVSATKKLQLRSLTEQKYDEIVSLCEKGRKLL